MSGERNQNVPSTYIVPIRNNKVLLHRRYNTGFQDGKYGFVAGHVESGETFIDGIIRETKEEAGIVLSADNLEMVHVMHRRTRDDERVDVFFKVTEWEGEPQNMEPHKCDDMRWFPINALPNNMVNYMTAAFESIQKGVIYSEYGWE